MVKMHDDGLEEKAEVFGNFHFSKFKITVLTSILIKNSLTYVKMYLKGTLYLWVLNAKNKFNLEKKLRGSKILMK